MTLEKTLIAAGILEFSLIVLIIVGGGRSAYNSSTTFRSVSGNSISDHLNYYGIALKADSWGSCRIVMGTRAEVQYNVDYNGNIKLSRDPTAQFVKVNLPVNTESVDGIKSAA